MENVLLTHTNHIYWKPSNTALYQILLNIHGYNCITHVFSGWSVVGVAGGRAGGGGGGQGSGGGTTLRVPKVNVIGNFCSQTSRVALLQVNRSMLLFTYITSTELKHEKMKSNFTRLSNWTNTKIQDHKFSHYQVHYTGSKLYKCQLQWWYSTQGYTQVSNSTCTNTKTCFIHKRTISALTVVSLSKAPNLSSCAAADFSKASCFLIRFSTSSIVCWKMKQVSEKKLPKFMQFKQVIFFCFQNCNLQPIHHLHTKYAQKVFQNNCSTMYLKSVQSSAASDCTIQLMSYHSI